MGVLCFVVVKITQNVFPESLIDLKFQILDILKRLFFKVSKLFSNAKENIENSSTICKICYELKIHKTSIM